MKPEKVKDTVVWLLGEGYKDGGDSEEEEIINPPPFMCGDVDPKVLLHFCSLQVSLMLTPF
jgi:hypothetical protein